MIYANILRNATLETVRANSLLLICKVHGFEHKYILIDSLILTLKFMYGVTGVSRNMRFLIRS